MTEPFWIALALLKSEHQFLIIACARDRQTVVRNGQPRVPPGVPMIAFNLAADVIPTAIRLRNWMTRHEVPADEIDTSIRKLGKCLMDMLDGVAEEKGWLGPGDTIDWS